MADQNPFALAPHVLERIQAAAAAANPAGIVLPPGNGGDEMDAESTVAPQAPPPIFNAAQAKQYTDAMTIIAKSTPDYQEYVKDMQNQFFDGKLNGLINMNELENPLRKPLYAKAKKLHKAFQLADGFIDGRILKNMRDGAREKWKKCFFPLGHGIREGKHKYHISLFKEGPNHIQFKRLHKDFAKASIMLHSYPRHFMVQEDPMYEYVSSKGFSKYIMGKESKRYDHYRTHKKYNKA